MTFLSFSVCIIDELCVVLDGRNKGGWDIYISNMGNCIIPSLFKKKKKKTTKPKNQTKTKTQQKTKPGEPNYNFNIKGVSLRPILASELGKYSCLISW